MPMRNPVSLLRSFQRLLSAIYDVPLRDDIADYVVTDRTLLPPAHRDSPAREQVLVSCATGDAADADDAGDAGAGNKHDGIHGAGTSVGISVFLDEAMLERLARADPFDALNGENVTDFWTVLEGVSHFLYLGWNAGHDRPVTLFELELQAEIDKYVSSLWLLKRQQPQRFPVELHHLLFERSRIDPALAGERIGMYQRADRYASRFCHRLARRLDSSLASVRLETMAELRRFYRLGHQRKSRHIDALALQTA